MSNNYFQFKQFTVHQQHCAMKVCTDACIFGAYTAAKISERQTATENILDIGTGTGLLSLMLAQKLNGTIDAIEIEEAAFEEAKHNFDQSPWRNRLNIFNTDALQYNPGKKYDLIISNPPFFEGDLRSGNKKNNSARHDTTLTLEQLLQIMGIHLSSTGNFAVLLPFHRVEFFIKIAGAADFYLHNQLLIRPTNTHPFSRGILFFSHLKTTIAGNELVIKNADGNYSTGFIELLKDYYLHL